MGGPQPGDQNLGKELMGGVLIDLLIKGTDDGLLNPKALKKVHLLRKGGKKEGGLLILQSLLRMRIKG